MVVACCLALAPVGVSASAGRAVARVDAVPVVIASIPVAIEPAALTVSPDGTRVYVVSQGDSGVDQPVLTVIDATRLGVSSVSPTCSAPVDIAAAGTSILVACAGDNSLRVFDGETLAPLSSIPLGAGPEALAVSPDGTEAFVLAYGSKSPKVVPAVIVVDLRREAVVARVRVGVIPRSLVLSASGRRAYVSNWGDESISVISTGSRRVLDTIDLGTTMPGALAVNPDGSRLLVNRENAGVRKPRILTINTEERDVVAAFRPGFPVDAMQYSAVRMNVDGGYQRAGTLLLVAGEVDYEEAFVIVDLLTQRAVSSVELAPPCQGASGNQDLAVAPDGARAYVLTFCLGKPGAVSVIDLPLP